MDTFFPFPAKESRTQWLEKFICVTNNCIKRNRLLLFNGKLEVDYIVKMELPFYHASIAPVVAVTAFGFSDCSSSSMLL